MNFRTMIASVCAVFGTACTTPPEPQKQTGKLVTDSSGCTYWHDPADKNPNPDICVLKKGTAPE